MAASDELRAEREPLTDFKLITVRAAFNESGEFIDPQVEMRHLLGSLAVGSSSTSRSRFTPATPSRAPRRLSRS